MDYIHHVVIVPWPTAVSQIHILESNYSFHILFFDNPSEDLRDEPQRQISSEDLVT